jgi:hypothetical protein
MDLLKCIFYNSCDNSLSVFSSLLWNYLIAFSFIPRDSSFPIRCPRLWDYRLILSLYLDGWIFIIHNNLNGLSRIFFFAFSFSDRVDVLELSFPFFPILFFDICRYLPYRLSLRSTWNNNEINV